MRYSKYLLAATGLAALLGFSAPASAGVIGYPLTISNASITGMPGANVNTLTGPKPATWAGLISVDVTSSGSSGPSTIVVFCDDLYSTIGPNHTYNYWTTYNGTVASGNIGASSTSRLLAQPRQMKSPV